MYWLHSTKLGRPFVISDIHGCTNTFKNLLLNVLQIDKSDRLYLLGDYINKGPDSKGTIDFIFHLMDMGYNLNCLRGNHEQYLIDGLNSSREEITFLNRGGRQTLESFGVDNIRQIPAKYLKFINSLTHFIETENYILVHAGLNFDMDNPYNDEYSMLNIRDMEFDTKKTGGKCIIHGHVPTPYPDIEYALKSNNNHISIDGGCVYENSQGLNYLAALDLQMKRLYSQKNIE